MHSPSPRQQVFLENKLDVVPLDQPLFAWPNRSSNTPQSYLPYHQRPFGRAVAEWQAHFFGLDKFDYRTEPEIAPIRPGAPTLVAIFYPDADTKPRRPLYLYLERIQRLADLGEQTVLYAPPSLAPTLRRMRSDPHWYIIDDYATVWDIPNNTYQSHNFAHVQPALFKEFDGYSKVWGWYPDAMRNHAHRAASYNSKAFATFDAVLRNPFGSESWMYIDAGIFDQIGPIDADGALWGDVLRASLCPSKFARSISVSGDSGIVMGEYMQGPAYGAKNIDHACWTDPRKGWLCHTFIAHAYVGSSLGMLNYSVRFMQTVDDMDANGWYSAREEFAIPWVAVRYPNTVFSIPWMPVPRPLWCQWQYPIKMCYTDIGGSESVPPIVDPISTIFCPGYLPRTPNLPGEGIYQRTWRTDAYTVFRQWYYSCGLRWMTKEYRNLFGRNGATDFLLVSGRVGAAATNTRGKLPILCRTKHDPGGDKRLAGPVSASTEQLGRTADSGTPMSCLDCLQRPQSDILSPKPLHHACYLHSIRERRRDRYLSSRTRASSRVHRWKGKTRSLCGIVESIWEYGNELEWIRGSRWKKSRNEEMREALAGAHGRIGRTGWEGSGGRRLSRRRRSCGENSEYRPRMTGHGNRREKKRVETWESRFPTVAQARNWVNWAHGTQDCTLGVPLVSSVRLRLIPNILVHRQKRGDFQGVFLGDHVDSTGQGDTTGIRAGVKTA
ncbi:hypothetical protein FB45DRAFT_868129 [Roridomyces roridus]|uniref:Uncharacterized protein n=1 Tax=Roridomyces roridus TaxID=1738132 RepID=A0AAD7BQ06_9AGAR|nr:hypothetical protein FB45DRAFT_868129 [Roridomyces roridus]